MRRLPNALAVLILVSACTSKAVTNGGSCVAPANPGGGWDLTCRAASEALGSGAPGGRTLRITNIPGEGGGVAYAKIVAESVRKPDPVIVAASPSTLLGLAQRHYGPHTERDVRWIAAVGAEPSVIAVRADAPWRTLGELMSAWGTNPDSVIVGGGSVAGGQDHMKVLLLARAAGIDARRVKYRALSGPLEAITSLRDGTIQVFPGDASEVQRQAENHEIRILAVLGERRAPGVLANVPTAREQGLDVTWIVWRGFYGPRSLSDAEYQDWVARLRKMSTSRAWTKLIQKNGLTPFFVGGAEFERFVGEEIANYRTVSRDIGIIK